MPQPFRLLIAIAALSLLSSCQSESATGDASGQRYGNLRFQPCTLTNPYSSGNVQGRCAQLEVAENPDAPEGRRIALNIAWLPATEEGAEAADPVFFLAGGPGQAAVGSWPLLDPIFADVRKRRHIILVDQRGTGKSGPLNCALSQDEDDAARLRDADAARAAEEARRCARSLDADPRFYATTDAVRDLEQVRAALGADSIDLVGVSYGTRVAQQYARRHGSHVRAMVLDGVVPNTLMLGSEDARNLDEALASQFQRCQAQAACRARFGHDLRGQLRDLIQRLRRRPLDTDYRDPFSGELRHGQLTAAHVTTLTRMFAYAPEAASLLPLLLSEADRGRHGPLMSLSMLVEKKTLEQMSMGMQLSVVCAEDAGLPPPADRDTLLGADMGRLLRAQCDAWPAGAAPADFHEPLVSDVPALLLSGELDPTTPPRYGDEVAKHLSRGRHLLLKGQGHNTIGAGCMPKLLDRFLETADAQSLDAGCLDALDYVPPFTSFNGWEP
ncbi:MAG: alpha/beta hydrolase [Xanthomonadaceae bacterium]|nr:alpha/beta hydrolase [Xanthomonadaceae bacterium]